jgi:hypothetical protein
MATKVGSLIAELGLNTARFQAGIKTATNSVSRFHRKTDRAFKQLDRTAGTAAKGMIAAYTAASGVMIKQTLDFGDQLAKLKTRLGLSVEAMSGLKFAADQSGVSFQTLTMGLQRMIRRVGEAANGTGEAEAALIELGISAKALNQLRPENQFRAIAESLSGVADANDKARLAQKLFDSEGVALLQLMESGAGGIDAYMARANELGVVMSQTTAKGAEEAKNALGEVKARMNAAALETTMNMIPAITDLANAFSDTFPKGIQAAVDAFYSLRENGLRVMAFLASQFSSLSTGMAQLFGDDFSQQIAETQAKIVELEQKTFAAGEGRLRRANEERIERLQSLLKDLVEGDTVGQQMQKASEFAKTFEDALNQSAEKAGVIRSQISSTAREMQNIPIEQIDNVDSAFGKVNLTTAKMLANMKSIGESIQVDIFDRSKSVFDQMADSFEDAVKKMVNAWVNSQLQEMIGGFLNSGGDGGGGGGGFLSSFLKNIPGFATGGSFEVGGRGGTDSNVIAFKATKGERVTVQTPQQQGMGGGVTIHNVYNVSGSGVTPAEVQQIVERGQEQTKAQIANSMRRKRF